MTNEELNLWKTLAKQSIEDLKLEMRPLGDWAWFELDNSAPVRIETNQHQRVAMQMTVVVKPMNVVLPPWTIRDLSADAPISEANKRNIWRQIRRNYYAFMKDREARNHNFLDNVTLFVNHASEPDDALLFAQQLYPLALDWWRAVGLSKQLSKLDAAYHQTRIRHHHRK